MYVLERQLLTPLQQLAVTGVFSALRLPPPAHALTLAPPPVHIHTIVSTDDEAGDDEAFGEFSALEEGVWQAAAASEDERRPLVV